jgi:thymidylate synthase (FAD)
MFRDTRISLYEDGIGEVSLIDWLGDDLRACNAARVSFLNDLDGLDDGEITEKDQRLLSFMLREKHTSPFEHSVITFRIKVPMFVKNQIIRHRTFSFNEVSRRYTAKEIEFFVPSELREQSQKNLQCSTEETVSEDLELSSKINAIHTQSLAVFNELLEKGVCREQARMVLPQSLYTTFWMTGSLHNWMHFLRLRTSPHSQKETQETARGIETLLREIFPKTFEAVDNL